MRNSRIIAPVAAAALAATTVLTVPSASAQLLDPVSPPAGTDGTCAVSVTTNVSVPGSGGNQRVQELDGMLEVGIQNWTTNYDRSPGFRPWARVRGGAERWMSDAHVDFTAEGAEGEYRQRSQPTEASAVGGVTVSHEIAIPATSNGNFSVDLPADFNATGPNWDEGATALWHVDGPVGALDEEGVVTEAELTLSANVLPWPKENVNCQPLGVDAAATSQVTANNIPQDTGARVTAGDADDHARLRGEAYRPGTDTSIDGAVVTVTEDGSVLVTVPPEVRDNAESIEVQLFATPRDDAATWDPYNNDAPVGERFTVDLAAYAPGYRHAITEPGVEISLKQNRDLTLPEGTTYAIVDAPLTDPHSDDWTYSVDPTTGELLVTPPEDAETGDYIVVPVQVTYPDGDVQTVEAHVTVARPGDGAGSGGSSLLGGSSVDGRCIATAGAVIAPLALLAPLALASQVNIPGVSPMIRDLQAQLQQANNELQQGLGINNPEIARLAAQINEALGPDAIRVLGAAGVAALSLLAVGVIADACLPGSSGSSLSSR